MNIYVTRHGTTPLNLAKKVNGEIDEPLAAEGIRQGKAAASIIPRTIKYIYHSPLIRAKHTAELLNSDLKRSLIEISELTEIHMGSLAGLSWEEMEGGLELKRRHRSVTFDYRPYGGESAGEVIARLAKFLKNVKERHGDKEALIVTHGGIIRTLYFLEKGNVVDETEKHVSMVEVDLDKILKNSAIKN